MKNVGGLIEAFAQLRNRIPHDLVLTGIKMTTKRRRIWPASSATVFRSRESYGCGGERSAGDSNLADAFVRPSLYEGFVIRLLEGMFPDARSRRPSWARVRKSPAMRPSWSISNIPAYRSRD